MNRIGALITDTPERPLPLLPCEERHREKLLSMNQETGSQQTSICPQS